MADTKDKFIAVQPRNIADGVAGFLKDGDLEGVVSMFHPECQIYFPLGEPPKIGLQGAKEVFKDFVKLKPILISTVTNEAIVGDTAILQATWEFKTAEGEVIAQGQSTEVAKKLSNGGWGYFIDCPLGIPEASDGQ